MFEKLRTKGIRKKIATSEDPEGESLKKQLQGRFFQRTAEPRSLSRLPLPTAIVRMTNAAFQAVLRITVFNAGF